MRRLAYLREDGEEFFDAAQNARVVRSAEQYYRLMYRSSAESWNLRDRHMFETLQALLKEGARAGAAHATPKAVIWAHNSHIGNAAATAMGWQGEFNIGELCRKTLQSHYFESVLSEQFDAWVWFEETSAVSPLPAGHTTGAPETYPFGL